MILEKSIKEILIVQFEQVGNVTCCDAIKISIINVFRFCKYLARDFSCFFLNLLGSIFKVGYVYFHDVDPLPKRSLQVLVFVFVQNV